MAGLYGKHRAFGDFISLGLKGETGAALENWLHAILPRAKSTLGEAWDGIFDSGMELRFWAGQGVLSPGPVCGILRPSRDKVGRRFPLLAIVEDAVPLPPVIDPDQTLYAALSTGLDALEGEAPLETLNAHLAELGDYRTVEADEPGFWAVNPETPVEELLTAIAATDHLRATRGRSYWWSAGDPLRAAAVQVCAGLPDADGFNWLTAGVSRQEATG
ncbi:type VI secretion system-associated protein TagF [Aestuariibius sp. 2305UL40-4]|uniref:type VI secretion system-associated protein TagF n=1 Tax=Aestuariibius violaceus TaxID=3234132 RepID=UPI00345E2A73